MIRKQTLFLNPSKIDLEFEFLSINFDLGSLLLEQNLENFDEPFSNDEIDSVIKSIPNDHAPGPDGFNGLFIKKS